MGARYYDPGLGRFITRDTWEGHAYQPWTRNLYTYGRGNPVIYIDPTGHAAMLSNGAWVECPYVLDYALLELKIAYGQVATDEARASIAARAGGLREAGPYSVQPDQTLEHYLKLYGIANQTSRVRLEGYDDVVQMNPLAGKGSAWADRAWAGSAPLPQGLLDALVLGLSLTGAALGIAALFVPVVGLVVAGGAVSLISLAVTSSLKDHLTPEVHQVCMVTSGMSFGASLGGVYFGVRSGTALVLSAAGHCASALEFTLVGSEALGRSLRKKISP